MSYCRSNGVDSDVYVIGTRDELECFGAGWELEESNPCHNRAMVPDWKLIDRKIVKLDTQHEMAETYRTNSRSEMIDHLKKHRQIGHKVPDRAIERLNREIQEEGDKYTLER